MGININCRMNVEGAWCQDPRVKRSLFGLGARCCVEFPRKVTPCEFKVEFPRPPAPRASIVMSTTGFAHDGDGREVEE